MRLGLPTGGTPTYALLASFILLAVATFANPG
jgi:hypothetical protein